MTNVEKNQVVLDAEFEEVKQEELKMENKKNGKFKKGLRKVSNGVKLFGIGAAQVVNDPVVISTAVAVGFNQGLKYNGDVKRGLKAAGAVMVAGAIIDGAICVNANKDLL